VRILIPLAGSRGDVQPGVTLRLEPEWRGRTVVVGAPPNFLDFRGQDRAASDSTMTADPHRHRVTTLSATQPHEPGCASIAPQGARGILGGVELSRDRLRGVGTER
jgi:hypothetical protein